MFTTVLCVLGMAGALTSPSSARSVSDDSDTWWRPISLLINDPCAPHDLNQSSSPRLPSLSFPSSVGRKRGKKPDCLPLNRSSFLPAVREAQDSVEELLSDKRTRRWTRGRFSSIARNLRCELKLCVPVVRRPGLNKAQMKAVEDLVQLASYAHYLDETQSTLKGKKNAQIRDKTTQLSKGLKVIGCTLRPAVTKTTLNPYVSKDDVPADLRHKKRRKVGRVATFVIWETLKTFLGDLPGTFRRNGFKLCKN